jgi:hypothetical protein
MQKNVRIMNGANSAAEVRPIRVMLVGVNEKVRAAIDLLFRKESRAGLTLVADAPDVGVFDYDRPLVEREWTNYRVSFPQLPTLIVSYLPAVLHASGRIAGETGVQRIVGKPIKPQELIEQLQLLARDGQGSRNKINGKTSRAISEQGANEGRIRVRPVYTREGSGSAATAIDDRLADAECLYQRDDSVQSLDRRLLEATGMEFDPSRYLLGYLRRAVTQSCEEGRGMAISNVAESTHLLVRPQHGGEVLVEPPGTDLRLACLRPLDEGCLRVEVLAADDPRLRREGWRAADEVLWEVALRTSRGRLPAGVPVEQPVRLLRWPNFTRLMESPGAMRIAALMVRAPISLEDVARRLSIEPGAVFSFFAAAQTLGLIEGSPASEAPLLAVEQSPRRGGGAKRGLIARLMQRLAITR